MADLFNLLIKGLSLGSLYALSAMGFVLIFRTGGVINLAHGQMMAMGAFIFLTISHLTGAGFIMATLMAAIAGLLLVLIIELSFIRPSYPVDIKQGIFATLGIMLMLKGLSSSLLPAHVSNIPKALGSNIVNLAVLAAGTIFILVFLLFLRRSSFGLYIRAVSDNRESALSIGIPFERLCTSTGIIAGMTAIISGILMIIGSGLDSADLGPMETKIFPAIVLGGLVNMRGAILGGILMGILETYAGGRGAGPLGDLLPYLLILVVMLLKRDGLIPDKIDFTGIKG